MPSGGTFSFLSDFICETNNTCYDSPKEKPKTYQIGKFSQESIEYLNKKNILESINEVLDYFPLMNQQRFQAEIFTKKIRIADILVVPIEKFNSRLSNISKQLDTTIFNMILNSTPNFNLLFSLYSANYSEPIIPSESYEHFKKAQNLLNLLYGPNLEVT